MYFFLKKIIESGVYDKDIILSRINLFKTAGKLTEPEADELISMIGGS